MIAFAAVSPSGISTVLQLRLVVSEGLLEATADANVTTMHNSVTFPQAVRGHGSTNNWVDIRRSA